MAINLNGRKVKGFRCHLDPMVGPVPRNAFDMATHAMEAELTPAGVYVKVLATGFEHLIPYANVQSIRLQPEAEVLPVSEKKKAA